MRRHILQFALVFSAANAAAQSPLTARPLTLVREARIDGVTEDLVGISSFTVSPAGRMSFYQAQDYHMRVYDASGKLLFKFGRQGEGPGEFQAVVQSGWVGDSLWVNDFRRRRITIITPDGKLAREFTMASVIIPATASAPAMSDAPTLLGLTSDGMVLVKATKTRSVPDPTTGLSPDDARLIGLATPDGTVRKTIADVPPGNGSVEIRRGGGMYGTAVPFVASPIESIAPDGSRIGYLTTQITSKTGGTYRITVLRQNGDTLLSRTYPFTGIPVVSSVADSMIENYGRPRPARAGGPPPRPLPADILADMHSAMRSRVPAVQPFIRSFRLGPDGTMWLSPRDTTGGLKWFQLDEKGNLSGSFSPAKGETFAMGSKTQVWMTSVDADGIQSVVHYRIADR